MVFDFEIWSDRIDRTTESEEDAARTTKIYQGTIDNLKGSIEAITASRIKQAEATKKASDELKKLNKDTLISILNANNKRAGDPEALQGDGVQGNIDSISLPTISEEDIANATAMNAVAWGEFQSDFIKQSDEFGEIVESSLKSIATQSIVSGLSSIGEAIAGGGGSLESGFAAIGAVLADGMKSLGAAMIAWGIGKIALDEALKSGNGYVALAAGAALVVAGAALGAAINKSQNSSPIGGSAGGGGGGSGRYDFDREGQTLKGEFVVRGTDLVLALNNQTTQDNRNVAG
jgi:hypothetical protein